MFHFDLYRVVLQRFTKDEGELGFYLKSDGNTLCVSVGLLLGGLCESPTDCRVIRRTFDKKIVVELRRSLFGRGCETDVLIVRLVETNCAPTRLRRRTTIRRGCLQGREEARRTETVRPRTAPTRERPPAQAEVARPAFSRRARPPKQRYGV